MCTRFVYALYQMSFYKSAIYKRNFVPKLFFSNSLRSSLLFLCSYYSPIGIDPEKKIIHSFKCFNSLKNDICGEQLNFLQIFLISYILNS